MGRGPAERVTSPAIIVAVIAAAIAIALRPGHALVVLAAAESIAALACALMVRTTLRRTPPAPSAAVVLAVFALFWAGMAAMSVVWFMQRS